MADSNPEFKFLISANEESIKFKNWESGLSSKLKSLAFKLLSENNLDLRESIVFPDHYKFKEEEIRKIIKSAHQNNLHIIMTEKDYYKIKKFNITNIEYLKINLEITDKEKFLQTVKEIYDKKN